MLPDRTTPQAQQASRRLQAMMGIAPGIRLLGKRGISVRLWEMPAPPELPAPTGGIDNSDDLIDLDLAAPDFNLWPQHMFQPSASFESIIDDDDYYQTTQLINPEFVYAETSNVPPTQFLSNDAPAVKRKREPSDPPKALHQQVDSVKQPQKASEVIDLTISPMPAPVPKPPAKRSYQPPQLQPPIEAPSVVKTHTLSSTQQPASPPPCHTTPFNSTGRRKRRPIFWSPTLSTSIALWLRHPLTQSSQTRLEELSLLSFTTPTTTADKPQPKILHTFNAEDYERLKFTHLIIPPTTAPGMMAPPGPEKPHEWLIITVISIGAEDDVFDFGEKRSDSSHDYEDVDPQISDDRLPYLTIAIPVKQVTSREGMANAREGDRRKTRFVLGVKERVPLVHGFGVDAKSKALSAWIEACALGIGGVDVVSRGEMPGLGKG